MDPFSVQPPAWLTHLTEKYDPSDAGDVAGTALGGGIRAATEGTSFGQGLGEARMSQKDPNWQMHQAILSNELLEQHSQMETSKWKLEQNKMDNANWLTQDLPALDEYTKSLKDNPDTIPPVMKSERGSQALQGIDRGLMAKEGLRLKQENSKIALENQKRAVDWNAAIGASDPLTRSQIAQLPNQGWIKDDNGRNLEPSPDAISILNSDRERKQLNPWGIKSTEVKKTTFEEQEKLRQEDRVAIEKLRQEDRLALEKARTSGAYAKAPDIFTTPEGHKFLLWGKQMRSLDSLSPQVKADVDYWTSHLKKLDTENIKEARPELAKEIAATKERIRKLLINAPAAPATNAPAATASPTDTKPAGQDKSDPLGLFR